MRTNWSGIFLNSENASQNDCELSSSCSSQKANYHLRGISERGLLRLKPETRSEGRTIGNYERQNNVHGVVQRGRAPGSEIHADIRLYLHVGGSISIFHPSNTDCSLQLTRRGDHCARSLSLFLCTGVSARVSICTCILAIDSQTRWNVLETIFREKVPT